MKTNRLLLLAALTCVSTAFAVDPPPDGGYPKQNTAEGEDALFSLTDGTESTFNTAIGYHALYADTTGGSNTAVGANALASNTVGHQSTALGRDALLSNIGGFGNVAVGGSALSENINGGYNVALGWVALAHTVAGSDNVAVGSEAMEFAEGSGNVAMGLWALQTTLGNGNVALGYQALRSAKGGRNIGVGAYAGYNLFDGADNIYIGNAGRTSEQGSIRIGALTEQSRTFIAGISGATIADGVAVVVGSNGHLGTITSSARFKEAIEPMKSASEAILSLQPVTFRYKKELDPNAIPQFGLVAEQVAKVDPDLVARDAKGKPYTVRYEAVNAMLLNEFLKEHRKVEAQGKEIAELRSMLEKQTAQLQKVSERLDAAVLPPRLVENR